MNLLPPSSIAMAGDVLSIYTTTPRDPSFPTPESHSHIHVGVHVGGPMLVCVVQQTVDDAAAR